LNNNTTKVLIIGAAGFMGRHITSAVIDAGHAIVGLDWVSPPPALSDIPWVKGSAFDDDTITQAATACSHVIFLGGGLRPASAQVSLAADIEAEVAGSVRVAEICAGLGVQQFIFASSGGTVYGLSGQHPTSEDAPTFPTNAYGYTKLMVEHALRLIAGKTAMKSVVLRITNPYGPGQIVKQSQGFIAAAIGAVTSGAPLPIWGDGSTIRDFIYVGDVARAFAQALTYEGGYLAVNISSGEGASLLQICEELGRIAGRKVDTRFEPARRIDLPVSILSNELALKELAWAPETTLEDGLRMTLEWWQAHQAANS